MKVEEKKLKIKLITPMLGTIPKDPEIYKTYIESKKPQSNGEDESQDIEKVEQKGWTGFRADENGLYLYDYMVKGFLKHAGNVLKEVVKVKALRSKLDDFVFVEPRKIYLGKDEADGVFERPISVMTMQGPRTSIMRSDFVNEGLELEFTIKLLPHKEISWSVIETLLEYGKLLGLGQFRNGSFGRFEVIETINL